MHSAAFSPLSFTFIASALLLVTVYALLVWQRMHRVVAVLLGATAALTFGLVTPEQAIRTINFNTVGLLVGMVMMMTVVQKSGLFNFAAIRMVQMVRASPAGALFAICLVTALTSALLNNIATVALIAPVARDICSSLNHNREANAQIHPYPFYFAVLFAANIGGAATFIGDPSNILIGSVAGLSFNDFLWNLSPVIVVILFVQLIVNYLVWGIRMRSSRADRAAIMSMPAGAAITNRVLLRWSLATLIIAILAFMLESSVGIPSGTVALLGGAILLLLDSLLFKREEHDNDVREAFGEVEWITIFFFIVIAAVEQGGLIQFAARTLLRFTGHNPSAVALGVLWTSAGSSALIENIPFVAAAAPMIRQLSPALGGPHAVMPLWWALALGACLGGNGTIWGASSNLVIAHFAEKEKVPFEFWKFACYAIPMTLLSIVICHAYILWRYY